MKRHLVVFPHGADLDLIGAARILQIRFPDLLVVQPRRLNPNAWDIVRRRALFSFGDAGNLPWPEIAHIHLLGIQGNRQNPEIIPWLTGYSGQVTAYTPGIPALPFPCTHRRLNCLSLTAWFLHDPECPIADFSPADGLLFRMAILERTQSLLAARTTSKDVEALHLLKDFPPQARQVSNQICLGLREGQKGLLHDLMKSARDIDINHVPAVITVVKGLGNVQELLPVMESLWSRLDPYFLAAAVIHSGRALVWIRHRVPQFNAFSTFQDFFPRQEHQWLTFSLMAGDPEQAADILRGHLGQHLSGEPTAGEIMVSPPQSVAFDETVRNTLDFMLKFNLMGLVVTRDDRYAGVISRRDLDRAVQMELLDAPITPFVHADCPTISPEMPVRVIKHFMVNQNLTRLPVVAQGNVLGIITSREVLRFLPVDLPLPRQYLPITRTRKLPSPAEIADLVKRIVSLKVFHWWKRIGEKAQSMGIKAYLVGGVVRDLLLERPNLDMDIVVLGDAAPFATAIAEELKGTVRVFDRFHTARVGLDDVKIDFSSARIEHYERAGALPQVEFSGLSNDLYRRDFSINALALDLSPDHFLQLIDFFGGYEHLLDRTIKILHSFSFLEDPTRMFRAMRFAVRFHFGFSEDTQRALDVAMEREIVDRLSTQRICAELSRCFAEEHPAAILQRMIEAGLLAFLHEGFTPQTPLPVRYRLIPSMIRRFQVLGEPIEPDVLYWAGLFSLIPFPQAQELLKISGFPAKRREKVERCLEGLSTLPKQLNSIDPGKVFEVYCLLKPLPIEALICLSLFGLDKNGVKRLFEFLATYRPKHSEISGKDLRELGIGQGPHYTTILQDVLRKKVLGELTDRKDELAYVRRTYSHLCLRKPE